MITTKPSEDAFKLLREAETQHPDGQLSRSQRFRICIASKILPASGRPTVPITNAAKNATKKKQLPRSVYECDAGEKFSLGPQSLREFSEGSAAPSPAAFNQSHAAWMAWLRLQDVSLMNIPHEHGHLLIVVERWLHCGDARHERCLSRGCFHTIWRVGLEVVDGQTRRVDTFPLAQA